MARRTAETDELEPLSTEDFRHVIGHFASGVTIITARDDDRVVGTTASAVCSLSLDPPMLLICMNETSETGEVIARTGAFAVNILGEGQEALAARFARKGPDKFDGVEHTTGRFEQPLLDDSIAQIECEVTERVTGGTHTVFLARVRSATAASGSPLAYYCGRFGRLELATAEDG